MSKVGVSKNRGTPQIIHFNGVWNHYLNHPFCGFSPIFGNTQIGPAVSWVESRPPKARQPVALRRADDLSSSASVPAGGVTLKTEEERSDLENAWKYHEQLLTQPMAKL